MSNETKGPSELVEGSTQGLTEPGLDSCDVSSPLIHDYAMMEEERLLTASNMVGMVKPMEMEANAYQPVDEKETDESSLSATRNPVGCTLFLRSVFRKHPKVAGIVTACLFTYGYIACLAILNMRKPVTRNRMQHDYSHINEHYDFRSSQMDHWCLWGKDDECRCLDFTEPESRVITRGWLEVHEENKQRVKDTAGSVADVVFLGDGMVEMLNGNRMGRPVPNGEKIMDTFKKNFTKEGGGEFAGLALGIQGDESANLIWRLEHGEMPDANIYWLWTGHTDLTYGYCSEEAIVLGILKTAELIAHYDEETRVVVQGILPVSRHDGILDSYKNKKAYSVDQARERYLFWPSIQAINKELEEFCKIQDRFIYFDASDLFIEAVDNGHYNGQHKQIISKLMPDYQNLSPEGYEVLLKHIKSKVECMLWEDNDRNAIEKKTEDDEGYV